MAEEDQALEHSTAVAPSGATVVVVAYGVDELDLGWVPSSVPVVVVHNDELLSPSSISRPGVRHVFPGTNVGFGAGVNLALEQVVTSRIVLCNPDICANEQHWTALQSDDPRLVVVVGQVDADGRPSSVVNRYPTPTSAVLTALRVGSLAPRGSRRRQWLVRALGRWGKAHAESLHLAASGAAEVDHYFPLTTYWPSASLMSIDTSLLRSVHGFDKQFFLYWEDVDVASRIADAAPDTEIKVTGVSPAIHLVGGSARDEATLSVVRTHRWLSARRYAQSQAGARWRCAASLLHLGASLTARNSGVGMQTPKIAEVGRWPAQPRRSSHAERRPIVAVVHATRRTSGETRRVASWLNLLDAAGFEPVRVPLLEPSAGVGPLVSGRSDPRTGARGYSWPGWRALGDVAKGSATPETLVWSHQRATDQLAVLNPVAVICVTLRAFSPRWGGATWPLIVDLVDPLSLSYRQRSLLEDSPGRKYGYRLLSRAASRAEDHSIQRTMTVAAGWGDAKRVGIPWIPNTISPTAVSSSGPLTTVENNKGPRWQALFVGSLDYSPNVDAVERLTKSIWPLVRAQRPNALLGIAGRRPGRAVIAAAKQPGVELIGEFADLADVARQSELAVSPLRYATGFQNKVLDAALVGLPQVVTSAAVAGFEPGLDVCVADLDEAIAGTVVDLLDQPARAEAMAVAARAQAWDCYRVARWVPVVRSLLDSAASGTGDMGGLRTWL